MSYPENDYESYQMMITGIDEKEDGYSLTITDPDDFSVNYYVSKEYGVIPKLNQFIRFYGKGLFRYIRGCFIDGQKLFYKTEQDVREESIKLEEQRKLERIENYKKNKQLFENKINSLPQVFQDRINKFRNNNPEFNYEYLSYELGVCEQAVHVANACKTVEKLKEFSEMNYDEQVKICPQFDDGHSGNSFGCTMFLSRVYIEDPDFVKEVHGALVSLVGCKEYGCKH